MAYYDPSFNTDKRYSMLTPVAGRYRIALDPIEVPADGVSVSYRDTVFHPLYGSVTLATAATVTVRARPEPDRQWMAQVGWFPTRSGADVLPLATQSWIVKP